MKYRGGQTRDGWGWFDGAAFWLQDSVYGAPDHVPFTICDLGGAAIAVIVEHPRTPELHARLAAASRPPWIDAVGQATRVSAPDARVALVEADLVAPADFDRPAFAVAAAIVLTSHGLFDREPESYQVRVGDESFTFATTFDWDTESWSADVVT